jgi:D-alanyl-D-alanine carboxypeptidase/D-alanyl-D-alanine-endopeptidase (penicillin-binding protein 4)
MKSCLASVLPWDFARRKRGSASRGLAARRATPVLLWILCWGCAGATPAPARAADADAWEKSLQRAATAQGLRGASLSALVVERGSGAVLWALDADALLVPASTQKLLTAVAALDAFGPAHRFVTELRASRPLGADGAIGDLFVRGGDPSLTSEQWWRLAADLRALGLREVRGDLVLDDSLFDAVRWHPSWAPITARAYHAPVGALTANFGAFRVRVAPGTAPGAPLEARVDPPVPFLRLVNESRTGKPGTRSTLAVERLRGPGEERIRVQGSVPLGAEVDEVWRSTADPLAYAGAVLRMQLEANGIRVGGAVRRGQAAPGAAPLLDFEGLPLEQVASLFLKYSNNFIAEALVKWLALGPEPAPEAPPASWAAGTRALTARLAGLGVPLGAARIVDGSGLSRGNRISARILVETLRRGDRLFVGGPELLAALPLAAQDGTLERRAGAARGRVRAKTGSLDGVSSLAGFARTESGRDLVFAVLANGYAGGDSAAVDAMDAWAGALVRD